ncbi:MAG: thymidylate synthase [Cyanobacteriota bacterium]
MGAYLPQYQAKHLICGQGRVALVTGWTVKESLARRLDPQDYGVIGNLYSATRGVSPLLRNLLANPQIYALVILQATKEDQNAGSCQCLLDFFQQGFSAGQTATGRRCWRIRSAVTGYIDGEISEEALELLRRQIRVELTANVGEAVGLVKQWAAQPAPPPWGNPQTFPLSEPQTTVFPGPRYGHRLEGATIAATWLKILHRIKTTGTIRPTAYGRWQELIDLTAIITDEPEDFYFPEPNYFPIEREFLPDYIAQILEDAPPREGVKYTYGQRLRSWFGRDQIQQAIDALSADPESSRIVLTLWDVKDYDQNNSPPCLNHLWLRIVEGELSLTATFRSNDMFSAWPANAMGLRALQRHFFEALTSRGLEILTLGPLIIISQSAHIYEDCWEQAERLIQTEYPKLHLQPDYFDPTGSFLISLQADKILVEHITPGAGEVVNCFSARSAVKLYQLLAGACPSLTVDHALYLGIELQKAETALKLGRPELYRQDVPFRL